MCGEDTTNHCHFPFSNKKDTSVRVSDIVYNIASTPPFFHTPFHKVHLSTRTNVPTFFTRPLTLSFVLSFFHPIVHDAIRREQKLADKRATLDGLMRLQSARESGELTDRAFERRIELAEVCVVVGGGGGGFGRGRDGIF